MTQSRTRSLPARARFAFGLFALLAWLPCVAVAQEARAPKATTKPFLWRIERQPPCYLYGTVHVPDPRVTTLPDAVTKALEASDALFTEIAIDKVGGAVNKMFLAGKRTLKDVVPEQTFSRLQAYLETKKVPPQARKMLDRSKVWAALMTLIQLEMMEQLRQGGKPLDMVIWAEAGAMDMDRGGLETVDEQLAVFDSFSETEQIEMLDGTLDVLEKLDREKRSYIDEVVKVYLTGDEQKLQEFMADFSGVGGNKELERRFEKLLIDDRNERMVRRMVRRMEEAPDKAFFFAVGAAHYPGEKGILRLLQRHELMVTRMGQGAR